MQAICPGDLAAGTIIQAVTVNTADILSGSVVKTIVVHPAQGFSGCIINTRSFSTPDLAAGAIVNPVFIIPADKLSAGIVKTIAIYSARQVAGTVVEPLRAGGSGEEQGEEEEVAHGEGGAGLRGKDTALFETGNSPANTILFFRFLFGSISGGQFSAGLSDFGMRPQCCVLFDRRVAQSIFLCATLRRTRRNSAVKRT